MKKSRLYSIIALAVSFTVLCASFFAPTIAKLVIGKQLTFTDVDGEHSELDYTVNSVFEVKTQDEFFAAINQGYSYVQLSKDIENPLIITESSENLERDLILDLNGIEIQRNGSDPILNVGTGVRLTVTDTSEEQTGGLYNPVGSVFKINGGILTVITGSFECGPRYSEYYSYNTDVLANNNNTTKRTVIQSVQNVNYYASDSTTSTTRTAPIILSYPTKTGDVVYNHGNLYFDVAYTGANLTISADTYCYYRTSEDSSTVNSATDADWYYTYYVDPDTYAYVGTTVDKPDDYVLITIYGYEKTLERASKITDKDKYYAAIQMLDGNLDVIKGEFFCYFGLPNTACVNAYSGTLTIKDGDFSSRIPNATNTTVQDRVPQKEEDKEAFVYDNYFETFLWAGDSTTSGAQARQGAAYGILTSSDKAKVSVGTGDFYSSNNNIINMSGGGELTIGSGTFTKQLTIPTTAFVETNAAVHTATDSTLTVSGDFTAYGAYTSGIFAEGGTVDVYGNFVLNGARSVGVYSKSGTLDVNGDFKMLGDSSAGVLSEGGDVTVAGDFTFSGASSVGVYSKSGALAVSGDFEFAGADSYGIYAEDGTITVDGNLTFDGASSYGVYSKSGTLAVSGDFGFAGANSYGIYAEDGTITVDGNLTFDGASSYGVYSKSGTLAVSGDVTLAGEYSYGVFSEGGNITMNDSTITAESNLSCYGVYINTTKANTSLSMEGATISVGYGVSNSKSDTQLASAGIFLASESTSTAINLSGTTTINSNELGIAIRGGTLNVTGTGTINTEYASAIAVLGGKVTFDKESSYTIVSKNTRSDATTNSYEMYLYETGKTGIVPTENYPNTDGVYVSGGDFTVNGTFNLTHTGLKNSTTAYDANGNETTYIFNSLVVTSYAVRVNGGSVKIIPDNANDHKLNVTSVIGGGVYCNGGSVTLGDANTERSDITVKTQGSEVGDYFWTLGVSINSSSWYIPKNVSGGHAVELNGGSIDIYNGVYEAAFGNGIYAQVDASIDGATVDVHDGEFYGWMGGETDLSGPGSCYGMKVMGKVVMNIYNGIFNGTAGGAAVSGISSYTDRNTFSGDWAEVYVYAGTFGTSANKPTDGFMVFDKAKVALGAGDSTKASTSAIDIWASLCPISVNQIAFNSGTYYKSYVYLYYGTYHCGREGGWNEGSFSDVIAYNTATDPALTKFVTIPEGGTVSINSNYLTLANNTTVKYFSKENDFDTIQ